MMRWRLRDGTTVLVRHHTMSIMRWQFCDDDNAITRWRWCNDDEAMLQRAINFFSHTQFALFLHQSLGRRRDNTMSIMRWYDGDNAITRWRKCDADEAMLYRAIVIVQSSLYHRAIDYFTHALFARKWHER